MTTKPTDPEELEKWKYTLVSGGRYEVEQGDCCMKVEFVARLVSFEDNEFPAFKMTFDNGVVLEGHGEYERIE